MVRLVITYKGRQGSLIDIQAKEIQPVSGGYERSKFHPQIPTESCPPLIHPLTGRNTRFSR
jgi:hypothetical protein